MHNTAGSCAQSVSATPPCIKLVLCVGDSDKADFYEHAVKLGAGPEALAGYAEGAVGVGRASSGSVYAAARRIVQAQPYNAAAHNVLGLACEARGDFEGSIRAYSAGLDVCTDHHEGWPSLLLLLFILQWTAITISSRAAPVLAASRTVAFGNDIFLSPFGVTPRDTTLL